MQTPSDFAAEEQGGIVGRVDREAYAAPFEHMALAGHQIDDGAHRLAPIVGADDDATKVEPERARALAV